MAYEEQRFNSLQSFGDRVLPDDDREFIAEEFLKLSAEQRVRLCAKYAEGAHHLAYLAPEAYKCFHLEIAQQWLLLAEAILRDERPHR
jgi:hypothetical protein